MATTIIINPIIHNTSLDIPSPAMITANAIMITMNARVSPPAFVLKKLCFSILSLLSAHFYNATSTYKIAPITIVAGTVIEMIFLRTSPSLPRILAVVVPKMILLGLTALPIAPPADCAPKIAAEFTSSKFAVCNWKSPNKILELILLPAGTRA